MRGTVLLLLCAITLAQAAQLQLTLSGKVCNCNSGEAASVCSQNGSDNELIVHENCNQFYKCSNGKAIPYYCPDITLYNPLAEICDWPENVQCGDRPIVAPGGGAESEDCSQEDSNASNESNGGQDNGGSDSGSGGTCNCNPEEAPALCAAAGSDGVLVAHQNCNQFYKCDHGVPVVLNCPPGLLYNPYTEQCDWPHNVDCGDRPIVEIEGGGGDNGGDVDCEESGNGNGESGSGGGSEDNGGGDNGGSCNCNPGEAPGICAADGSDGVLVAHENCNQFYKCAHGVPVALNCYGNLLYNPYTEQCDWPHNVECGDRPIVEIDGGGNDGGEDSGNGNGEGGGGGGSGDNGGGDNGGTCNCNPDEAPGICAADGSDGTLIAHENCNQFYKCNHGVPVTKNCPPGLVYNPYIECCDWPYNVDCGDKPIVEIEGGGNGESGGDNGSGGENGGGNSNEDNSGTCNCNPEDAPGICSADGSEGTLVAHENCNQFYKCAHGSPVTMTCPPGLVYNPYIECCDWPANVNCGDKPIVEVEGGGNGDNGSGGGNGDNGSGGGSNGGSSSEDNGGTCNCNPGEAPGICAADGSDGVLIAHENCNQFYKCAHGVPVALNCNGNLLYNPFTQQCDWPHLVDCGDRPIAEIDGGDNGGTDNGGTDNGGTDNGGTDNGGTDNGGTDNGGTDNGDGTCNCNPGEAPGICAADGSDGVLIAHENCNQFYKCAHGVPVALNCNGNLLYNPFTQQCDWPHLVDCGDRPIAEIDGGDNGGTDNGGTDNGGTDNGGTDNGGTDNGGTDNGGTDNGDGTCNCNPGEAPGICAADGSDGVLIAHENCNQFYKCAHGVPVALNCNGNLLYNPFTQQCDWPHLVDCGDRPIAEIDGGDNGGTDNGGTDNGGTDNGGTDNGGTDNGGTDNGDGTCNCNPGEAPGICAADGSDGVLIAHENCNQFYKCAHGVPVALNCNGNLLYNPFTQQCDWPHLVDCGDRPIAEIDGGDNGGTDNGGADNGGTDNGGTDNGGTDNGGTDNGDGTCNCNPGEAPGICAADGSDGVLIAHENCNQFYKCAHGVPVALNCNGNLLYNPFTQQCDWPHLVDCGDRPIAEIDGGDNGGTDNGGTDNGGTDNGGTDNGGTDNGGTDNGGTDNGDGTCNCNPGEAPGICAADGSDGVLIAHENCNQFYKCAHGVPVALNCNGNLLYNPFTQQCDWPHLVDCGDRPIAEIDGGDNGGTDNGGTDNGGTDNGGTDNGGTDNGGTDNGDGTCNCNPGEAPGICAADGSDGVLIAHENCNQFYKCAHGVPIALNCNGNLLYNPFTQQCDWPHLVDCGDRPIAEIDGGDNGGTDNGGTDNGGTDNGGTDNGGTDNGGTDNGDGTCNCNPGEAPGICAADGSDGVLIAHENCNQFYKCAHGVPVALYCFGNLLYNPYIEQCDWPAQVECGNRPIGNTEDQSGNNENESDDKESCNCNPEEASGICAAAGSDGQLIAHENCNQFYVCAHGIPVCQFCPETLLYNPYTQRCDWSHLVECGDRPIVENDGGNEDNGGTDNSGEDNGDGDNVGTCNCNPDEAPSICSAAGSDGTLVAHENCNQFYKCAHGLPIAIFCSGNLLYNPFMQRCDWPSLVECGNRPIVENEGGSDGNEDGGNGDNGGDSNGDTCDPSQAPTICAASGSDGILVSHENCNQFYVCTHGEPVALNCPSNLLYNSNIRDCDWPQNVDCGDRIIPESGGNDGPCACNAREAPSICSGSKSNGKLIAHDNCAQYYVCFDGVPVARSCPHSLFYEPHTEQCLWPSSVSCVGRVITTYSSLNKHIEARRGTH